MTICSSDEHSAEQIEQMLLRVWG